MASKSKKALGAHCRVFTWLQEKDSELATAIRDLCLEGALSGGRGGVTLLYPTDRAYREEIVEKAYSGSKAGADEAVKLINSLIMPDALVSGADFARRPVGSRLGVKFEVESADAKRVKLAGGVELTPAEDFRPFDARAADQAVWIVAKGRLPLSGPAYSAPPPAGRRPAAAAKTGGAADAASPRALRARALAALLLNQAMAEAPTASRLAAPYLAASVSLLNYLRVKNPEVLASVAPLIDYNPVTTFFLLVEPHKLQGDYLIADGILFGEGAWNGCCTLYVDAVAEYCSFVGGDPAQAQALAAAKDFLRQARTSAPDPRAVPAAIAQDYRTLCENNTVNGMADVLPAGTLAALGGDYVKKLWQDQVRFHIACSMALAGASGNVFAAFAKMVQGLELNYPGNDYQAEMPLLMPERLDSYIGQATPVLGHNFFLRSTCYLYTAVPAAAVGPAMGGPLNSNAPLDPYNVNAEALAQLRGIPGMARSGGLGEAQLMLLQLAVAGPQGAAVRQQLASLIGAAAN